MIWCGRGSASLNTGVPHRAQKRRCITDAAVGDAHVIGQGARDLDGVPGENRVDRAASRAEILADAAPTLTHTERRVGVDLEPHGAAKTSTGHRHRRFPRLKAAARLGGFGADRQQLAFAREGEAY